MRLYAARHTVEKHDGYLPDDRDKLMEIGGVGLKIAIAFLNSIGRFDGSGPDVHVTFNMEAWDLTDMVMDKQLPPKHAEAILAAWVPREKFPVVNRVFGSMGQMFTQQFPLSLKSKWEDPVAINLLAHAMHQCLPEITAAGPTHLVFNCKCTAPFQDS